MTYKRTDQLRATIEKLFLQTFQPEYVLVVDNDPAASAREVASEFSEKPVSYHQMGYNSGPAGAAFEGLRALANNGCDWIAWIDDDDPPVFEDTFEVLLGMAEKMPACGCVGVVGQKLDRKKGLLVRFTDLELEGSGALKVDCIAGNMYKLVNGSAIRSFAVLPDPSLFFGFEELDFDLSLQRAGFNLYVDKEQFRKHRDYFNRTGVSVQRGKRKEVKKLRREYYSIRNSLIIFRKNCMWTSLMTTIIRSKLKLFAGFRFGFTYGCKQAGYVSLALFHFIIRRTGNTITLI